MTTALFEQTLTLARQLTVQEQARLIGALAEVLAAQPFPAATAATWVRLEAFRHEMEALGPDAPNFGAARLEADRSGGGA